MTVKEFLYWQINVRKFGKSLSVVDRRDRLYFVLKQEYPEIGLPEIVNILYKALPTPK